MFRYRGDQGQNGKLGKMIQSDFSKDDAIYDTLYSNRKRVLMGIEFNSNALAKA